MARHKFRVGQVVYFKPGPYDDRSVQGRYVIARLLPEVWGTPQYRIKSELDGHERVVRENQLERQTW